MPHSPPSFLVTDSFALLTATYACAGVPLLAHVLSGVLLTLLAYLTLAFSTAANALWRPVLGVSCSNCGVQAGVLHGVLRPVFVN